MVIEIKVLQHSSPVPIFRTTILTIKARLTESYIRCGSF